MKKVQQQGKIYVKEIKQVIKKIKRKLKVYNYFSYSFFKHQNREVQQIYFE